MMSEPLIRTHASTSTAASDACGISGTLLVPQTFGNIYLGETLRCYVSLANFSERNVTNVSIKARARGNPAPPFPLYSSNHLSPQLSYVV